MKKKYMGALLAIILLITAFSSFVVPVRADSSVVQITEQYFEDTFTLQGQASTVHYQFTVPFDGYYIIQTLGYPMSNNENNLPNNGASTAMNLYAGGTALATGNASTGGYGRGHFIHCELVAGTVYSLNISFFGAQTGRLSITYARGSFNETVPIQRYTDISTFSPTNIPLTFYAGNKYYAQIALVKYTPDANEDAVSPAYYLVDFYGESYMDVYLFDPTTTEYYGGQQLNGYDNVLVEMLPNVPYYLVVFMDRGMVGDDYLFEEFPILNAEVVFTRIS